LDYLKKDLTDVKDDHEGEDGGKLAVVHLVKDGGDEDGEGEDDEESLSAEETSYYSSIKVYCPMLHLSFLSYKAEAFLLLSLVFCLCCHYYVEHLKALKGRGRKLGTGKARRGGKGIL